MITLLSIRLLRYTLLSVIVISLLLHFCCPAYAAAAGKLRDAYTDESLFHGDRFHGLIGGGLSIDENIIIGARRETAIAPLFVFKYDDWVFLSLGEASVWLYQNTNHSLKLGASILVHPAGPDVAGMVERRSSFDGSIDALWLTPAAAIGARYFKDIGAVSHGDSATLRIFHVFVFNQVLFNREAVLIPGVNLEWESARLADYYYGVRPEEATPGRSAYAGRNTINIGAYLTGLYRINRSWALLGQINTKRIGAGIEQSPIVSSRYATGGFFGGAWFF